jgi:hypothetical protein
VKVTIDGRLHTSGALLQFLRTESAHAREGGNVPAVSEAAMGDVHELIRQDNLADGCMDEVEIVGHPTDDLEAGSVLLSCGPVSIECDADELRRAVMPFVRRRP